MLAQLGDVTFGYPGTEIFAGLTLQVNPGDRIGLVGPNGAGKSTLLRLMSGALKPDVGTLAQKRGTTMAYLKQSQEFAGAGTIWDALLLPFADLLAMRAEIEQLSHQLDSDKALARYGDLDASYTERGGYTIESRAAALALDLGFTEADFPRLVDTLSGGERGRLELARTLLMEPDLLLLDEPTNHLDVAATEHLEERLRDWKKAFVLVSHDRYFLRATCTDIVELEGGKAVRFSGGYDRYVIDRAARIERLETIFERQQEHIAKTEEFIRKNIAGVNTKMAQGRRKQLEKLEKLSRPQDEFAKAGEIGLKFSVGDHAGGKEAVKTEGLSVGYPGGPPLVRGLDLTIYRGERVGIVGPNGCGKSTLMKTLLGKLPALAGTATLGHEVRVGYFDQKLSELDEDKSLIDEVRSIRGDLNEDGARAFLGRFRFSGDDPFRKVKGLSGGERNRLSLAKMMLRPRNLLALDEPTNHLDIPAREVLEDALAAYAGTVLVISHDRYFLDRVATKILSLEDGVGTLHSGNYTDLRDRLAAAAKTQKDQKDPSTTTTQKPTTQKPTTQKPTTQKPTTQKPPAAKAPAPTAPVAPVTKSPPAADDKSARMREHDGRRRRDRETQGLRRRVVELEKLIAETEAELGRIASELVSNHAGDWQRLHALVAEKEAADARLVTRMAEWEELTGQLERQLDRPPADGT